MRKSRDEAAETRRRIVSAAAESFRRDGVGASGLNDLMAAAGLTRGGFYKHFESKEQLVTEAFEEALAALLETLRRADAAAPTAYLTARHRDHPEAGCPLSAIGSELARTSKETRSAATKGFEDIVALVAADSKKGRRRALAATCTMIGAMTMSRVVDDAELSAEILKAAEKTIAEL